MAKGNSRVVTKPNLGLYFDRSPLEVPERGLTACNNVRIVAGKLTNQGIGWTKFTVNQLNGPVTLIDTFFLRNGGQVTVFGSTKDLYRYDEINDAVEFITPREETGTVDVSAANPAIVAGTGTAFDTNGLKAGDEISFGAIGENDPAAVWYVIDTVDSDVQLTLVTAVTGAPLVGVPYTARKLFTGTERDYFTSETFPKAQPGDQDLWFATNGTDFIVKWDGIADQVTLLDTLGFRCRELLRFKNMLIYGNLSLSTGEVRPYSIRNSAIGEPENVTTKEAAEFTVSESLSEINALLPLGDVLVVYTSRDIVLAQFVGTPLGFTFRSSVRGIGPITGRMVADFGDFHTLIGPDAKYRYDGVTLAEEDFQVWREVIRQRAPDRTELGLSHFDEERGVIVWSMPRTTDPDTRMSDIAMLEHYTEDIGPTTPTPYTQQNLPVTATGFFERLNTLRFSDILTSWQTQNYKWNDQFFQAAFPLNLFGDANGFIYTLGTTDSFDGAPIEAFARFARRPALDERNRGVITRIYPFAERLAGATHALGVLLWVTDQAAGDLTLAGQFLYDLTHAGNRFVSVRQAARFLAIEFATTGVGEIWTLWGFDYDVVLLGER